ncbi:hypothetical protein [Streptomyces griseoaurantiacus]|uniref:hypothetical protein n=1 Tax=Streptomyces griseoaurantiacus TaxID=68213 RepID=UPI002E29F6EF|nr:hypothetical protein [Streptomyces jietaisiensis]
MSIHVSEKLNNLLFVLIGERMLQGDEDKADANGKPYGRLARRMRELSDLIGAVAGGVGRSLPPRVGNNYVRAMHMFLDDGGVNHLKAFAKQLDDLERSRVKSGMDIMEAKWQIIAELVRLLIELMVIAVLSAFTGGTASSQAAVARARSTVAILTVMHELNKRTHAVPAVSEMFEEAFQTFAVRLAMMKGAPPGRRPDGFDWNQIVQDGVFGAFTGLFYGFLNDILKGLKKNFKNLSNSGLFKDVPGSNNKFDIKIDGSHNNYTPNPTPHPHADPHPGPEPKPNPHPDLTSVPPPSFTPVKLSPIDRFKHELGEDAGHFLTEGGAEALGELATAAIFHFPTEGLTTFLGGGLSSVSERHLGQGASWLGGKFNFRQPPSVNTVGPDDILGSQDNDRSSSSSGSSDSPGGGNGAPSPGPGSSLTVPPSTTSSAPGGGQNRPGSGSSQTGPDGNGITTEVPGVDLDDLELNGPRPGAGHLDPGHLGTIPPGTSPGTNGNGQHADSLFDDSDAETDLDSIFDGNPDDPGNSASDSLTDTDGLFGDDEAVTHTGGPGTDRTKGTPDPGDTSGTPLPMTGTPLPQSAPVVGVYAAPPMSGGPTTTDLPDAEDGRQADNPTDTSRASDGGGRPAAHDATDPVVEPDILPATAEFTRTRVLVPDGVEQPATSRTEVGRILNRMLRDPGIAENVLRSGAQVVVVPRDTRVTDLPEFAHLTDIPEHTDAGTRTANTLRALTDPVRRIVAVPEENLVGEVTATDEHGHFPDGYSAVTHELAHLVHQWGLDDGQRALLDSLHAAKLKQGPAVQWPDGPRMLHNGTEAENYSSRSPAEYFSQLTNAYLGTNKGPDPFTRQARNNGTEAVRAHEPAEIHELLRTVYGARPLALVTNPVTATRRSNEMYEAFNDFQRFIGSGPVETEAEAEAESETEVEAEAGTEVAPADAPLVPVVTVTPPLDELPTIVVTPPLDELPTIVVTPPAEEQPAVSVTTGVAAPLTAAVTDPARSDQVSPLPQPALPPDPTPELTPKDDDPDPDPGEVVTTFGTRRDGAQALTNITPVPDHVVEWLQERAMETAEAGAAEDAAFREAVRGTLSARLLTAEWPRLFSDAGLPLNVTLRGQRYAVSLRLRLSFLGPAPEQMRPMPDGPPVGIQRWAFGIHEDGDTSGAGDLRALSLGFSRPWAMKHGALSSITFAPQIDMTWNQLSTTTTAGRTVQPMVLWRSKGRSLPFDFAMTWQVRRNTGSSRDVLAGIGQPEWQDAGETPAPPAPAGTAGAAGAAVVPGARTPLTVWFPTYLAQAPVAPVSSPEGAKEVDDAKSRPAPLDRLLDELPLFGPESLVHHDGMFGDLLEAFPVLGELSERSVDELFEFMKEGNQRSNLPQSWDGSVASPTLYSASGAALGYLRFSTTLSGGTTVTGPASASSVLESYVLRSLRMQGASQITNSLGITLPLQFGLSSGEPDPVTGAEPLGGSVSGQVGASHQFAHTLASAGSARLAHSLRTGDPLLPVRPDLALRVTLVRPDSAPVGPAAGSRLGNGATYPLHMRVPSEHTLGRAPEETRYLPREVLHLTQLGVSTTPLRVTGTEPLFDQAETWLRDNGYLPSDRPQPRLWDSATEESLRVQRLNNKRKLDRMRSRLALRGALDEMIEGGDAITFELPTPGGTRRATVRLRTARRYTHPAATAGTAGTAATGSVEEGRRSDNDGVVHERTLPNVQTLNYVGSTLAGDEQFQRTPFGWSAGGGAFVTNPFGADGDRALQELGARYTYSRARSTAAGSSAGTGHEYYMLSPTANGTQVFSVPVTHTMTISDSHAEGLAPAPESGTVRLAVPTDRTSTTPHTGPRPKPAVVRDVRESDTRRLAGPGPGHTYHDGVLRLPETALLERAPGSAELREVVPALLDRLDEEAARQEERALRAREPLPGAFPEDIDLEAQDQDEVDARDHEGDTAPADGTPADPDPPAAGTTTPPDTAPPRHGLLWDLVSGAGSWLGGQATGAARWAWRTAFGEPAMREESSGREVFDTAFSPQHMAGNALRVFRDSYVVESAGTPGLVTGTDYLVEVEGYLTDVELLPEGEPMDAERWLQSVDASAFTLGVNSSHQVAFTSAGRYGPAGSAFTPSGSYAYRRGSGRTVTSNDVTGVFRVTVEDTTPVYRFTAKAHLVVTATRGRRNAVSGSFDPSPGLSATKVVEPEGTLEFLLVDNDLQNHPELAALALRAGRSPLGANRPDRLLPSPYVSSGGVLGFGAASDVHPGGGRKAFTERVRRLVEREAPGTTVPGHAGHLPGVLSRINEHGTSLGLRALVNAGPRGHTAFHFVHRSWLGPRLVEVALVARPARGARLTELRGKLVTRSSGLDNVFGHSRGAGTALDVPGATRIARSTGNSHELTFSPAGRHGSHRFRPTVGAARRTTWQDAQLSSRELRSWQRTFGNTAEFRVPYEYVVTVRSWPLDDALIGRLIAGLGDGLTSLAQAAGVVDPSAHALSGLPWAPGRTGVEPAEVVLRFNSSETTGESPALTAGPGLFLSDPRIAPPPADPGDAVLEMDLPEGLREVLNGPPWVPSRPFQVYDFAGVDRLGEALRAVDPSLRQDLDPRTSRSAEGMFIRLTTLAAEGRLALLDPAATAPYLGNPGGARTSVSVRLHAPRAEVTTKDTAIDRIELSADGFQTQADTVLTTSATFEYSGGSGLRGGVSGPLGGERASFGQSATASSQRRELLRFGTPMENDKGEGMEGHRVRAVAVLEVRGPGGTRFVTGDILFRTTEAPPEHGSTGTSRDGAKAPARTAGTSVPAPAPPVTTYDSRRPVGRYGGGQRLLTSYQWGRLDSTGETPRDVPGDGDCFFRAVLEVAGPHVRGRLGLTESDGLGDVLKKMRAETAAELTEHPERYAERIRAVDAGTSTARLAADIRTRGNYANLAGDLTPWIASVRLGLRLRIVTPSYEISMGPKDGLPVTLVQVTDGPLHFLAGVPRGPVVPAVTLSSPGPGEPAAKAEAPEPSPVPSLADTAFEILTGLGRGPVV